MTIHRDSSIDITRCISNYMIVLLHASAVNQYCNQATCEAVFWNFIYDSICPSALPALFFISGYLMFKNYSINGYYNKIKRRVGRLVVPYISWNILFIVIYLIGSIFVPRLSLRVEGFDLHSLSGVCSKVFSLMTAPIDGPLWFIRALFIYSLLSPIIAIFLRNVFSRVLFVFILLVCAAYFTEIGFSARLTLTYPVYSLMMFFIGGVMSKTFHEPFAIFKNIRILFISVFGLVIIAVSRSIALPALITGVSDVFSDFFKMVLLVNAASLLNTEKVRRSPIYEKLREMSFFAYAGHFLFCSILLHLIAPTLSFLEMGKQTFLTAIFFFGGICIMWLVYFPLKKIAPRILGLFDGTLKL